MTTNIITPKIDFGVTERELKLTVGGQNVSALGHRAIVRRDTNEVIAVVGSRYKVVDHRIAIERAAKAVSKITSNFQVQHSVNGAKIFTRFVIGEQDMTLLRNIPNEGAAMAVEVINSYDGSHAQSIAFSVWRKVCSNGMYGFAKEANIRHLHTASLDFNKMAQGIEKSMNTYAAKYEEFYNSLVGKPVTLKGDDLEGKLGKKLVENARKVYLQEKRITGENDAWTQYNSFTRAITHDDKMSEGRKQELSRLVSGLFLNTYQAV